MKKLKTLLTKIFLNSMHSLAPTPTAKLIRKHGFRTPRYKIGEKNQLLIQQAQIQKIQMNQELIHVYTWNSSTSNNSKTALLVHGWGTSGLQLSSFVEPLLAEGYKVVSFDHKGHGFSSSTNSSFLEFLNGTRIVVNSLNASIDVILGHSMGASIVLKVAEEIQRPLSVIAIAPMIEVEDMLRGLGEKVGVSSKVMKSIIKSIEDDVDLNFLESAKFNHKLLERHKVLLVHDRNDEVNPLSRSQELQMKIACSKLIVTNNFGHNRLLRDSQVIGQILNFISSKD